jgi:hypothetical protein
MGGLNKNMEYLKEYYYPYEELVNTGYQRIYTKDINKENIDSLFDNAINILKDGIETNFVQHMKINVVFVDKIDINEAVTNSIILLSSISYNNNVLESVIGDNALEFSDETYNIFETKEQQTNYLKFDEDIYEGYEEPEVEDPDLVG